MTKRVNIPISADMKQFQTDMQRISRDMVKIGKRMERVGKKLTRNLTLPLALAGAAMIKFSSDTQESLNKVDVAFGESSQDVKDFADTTLKSFGIARGSALDMASTFGDMGTSMGVAQDRAAKMSIKLVSLAGDMASFKNIRIDVAQTALNAVFTGETESLKLLGIVMTQVELNAFAMTQGITKTVKEMSSAEKVALRYEFILEKTKNSQGDFERTGGAAANQMRIFQEGLKELAQTFGDIILPIFTKIVKRLNEMVSWFSELSDETKKTILVVAGLAAALGPLVFITGSLIKNLGVIVNVLPQIAAGSKAMWAALISPAGLAVVAIAAVAFVMHKIFSQTKDIKKETSLLQRQQEISNRVSETTTKNLNLEVGALAAKIQLAKLAGTGTKKRLKLINEINSTYGTTLKNLSDERSFVKQLDTAYDDLLLVMENRIRLAAIESQLIELTKKGIEIQRKQEQAQKDYNAALAEAKPLLDDINAGLDVLPQPNDPDFDKIYNTQQAESNLNNLNKALEDNQSILKGLVSDASKVGSTGGVGEFDFGGGKDKIKSLLNDIERLRIEASENEKKRIVELSEFNLKVRKQEINASKSLASEKATLIKEEELNTERELVKSLKEINDKGRQGEFDADIAALDKWNTQQQTDITGQFEATEKGQKQHTDKMLQQTLDYLMAEKELYEQHGMDVTNINNEIANAQMQALENSSNSIEMFKERMMEAMTTLRDGIQNLLVNGFEDFFSAILQHSEGNKDAFKNFGQSILANMADFMSQFGKLLIAGAIASEAAQRALFVAPPVALAAGIALVGIAGAIKGHLAKNPIEASTGGMSPIVGGGGVSNFNQGISNATRDKTILETVIFGPDIRLVSNRANAQSLRTRRK